MQVCTLAAVSAAPAPSPHGPTAPRRRPLVRPLVRCSATVSEQKAGEQEQAAGGQPPGGGNGALAGAAAPAAQQLPQPPKLPVNQTVCMEGEAVGCWVCRPGVGRFAAAQPACEFNASTLVRWVSGGRCAATGLHPSCRPGHARPRTRWPRTRCTSLWR